MNSPPASVTAEAVLTVGISEMKISRRREDVLATFSLGSCVGLALHDPGAGVGALVHCLLPQSSLDPKKAAENPFMFVDTGVVATLEAMFAAGATRKTLKARLAGGANVMDDKGLFRIGDRNVVLVRKVLWKNEILISAEDVGGTQARTVHLYVATGRMTIRSGAELVDL